MTTTAQIAKTVGIAPRTARYILRDEYGFAYDGGRTDHVLAALGRANLPQREKLVALGLQKCYATGRMNVHLARRVRETYTPYQICGLVTKIAAQFPGEPTIGALADTWINQHADQL